MSTTLVPPSFYAVRSRGRPPHLYRSVGDAATALVGLASTAATVYVVTGGQARGLSDRELGQLGRCIRTRRLASERRWRELTAADVPGETADEAHALRRLAPQRADRHRLRIAMLAPPWITVPPRGYGGIEAVVALLCDEMVARGHEVTLFAAPGSHSTADVQAPLERTHADQIGSSLHESDHIGAAFDAIDVAGAAGRPFDVVHDHSGFTAVAMAARVSVPVVHTIHAPFNDETRPFYTRHGHKVHLVAISRYQLEHAPPGVRVANVVPNPIRVGEWPFCDDKDDYLLWMGRMDPVKGAQRAIAVARQAGVRLVLAGPVQPGQEDYFRREIAPHLDGPEVDFVGEVGGTHRKHLFAHAKAFLMPIRWAEPFGMVMVEALACGTPVLAFPEGAASEIVIDSENGFLVADEQAMADAIGSLDAIDPIRCRESVISRYDSAIVAAGYEAVYRSAAHLRRPMAPPHDDDRDELVNAG